MSIKTLLFGQPSSVNRILQTLNPNTHLDNQQTVHVQTITIDESKFLFFLIHDRSLITEQAVGTNSLVFFIDHSKPLYEEKQFLVDVLNSRRQFESVPLVVLYEKQQGFNIKDIINYFELFKMKQRTSMIKQVNFSEKQSVVDVLQWIDGQSQMKRSLTTFDAMPKVVKLKPKYRESQQDQSVKKYEGLLKNKQFRAKDVKDQQQQYIEQQKQRIKNQNMEKQLANFNKNKKKMTPYDIKASPNPKIQANLHFFLKDPKSQKQPQVNIKIQTDDFKPKAPQKPYVPKKTGINTSTQIEQNQLFSFDKQVKPILNILVIKALQTAALQIQEEQQFARIQKYKASFNERVRKQMDHEKKMIDEELAAITKKQKLLEQSRKKHESKKAIKKRLICYQVGNKFLQNIYKRSNLSLYNKNQYVDDYENEIQTRYLDRLIQNTALQMQKLGQKDILIKGTFEKDCISPVLQMSQKPKKQREALRNQAMKRRINNSEEERVLHLFYKHQHQNFSTFSKHLPKHFDLSLDEFIRIKDQEHQDVIDKIASGDLPQDELQRRKITENIQFGKDHQAFLVSEQKQICFTGTANRYEKPAQGLISLGFVAVDKQGEILESSFSQNNSENDKHFTKNVHGLRSAKNVVNMDQGVLLNLKNVPENAKSVILFVNFNNVNKYFDESESKKIKYSSYGLQFYEYGVQLHKENIAEKINWADMVKAPEGDQGQSAVMNVLCVAYILHKKPGDNWIIEHTRYVSKPSDNVYHTLQEITKFYGKSLEIFKQEEEQQNESKKESKKQKKNKSKKTIQQPIKVKPSIKCQTRVLPQIKVRLSQSIEQIRVIFENSVKEWKQFTESCQAGWQIIVKGKAFESVEQLKRVQKVGDIRIQKLKPIIEEEKKSGQQTQNELNQQGGEES